MLLVLSRRLPSPPRVAGTLLTFALVAVGWIIFRADSLSSLGAYLAGMCRISTLAATATLTMGKQALLLGVALLVVEGLQRHRSHALDLPACGPFRRRAVRWAVYYGLIALLLFLHAEGHTFIYFQF